MKPNAKLIAAFDDLVGEDEVIRLTGYSKKTLANKRSKGEIWWSSMKGKKIVYSKTNIAQLLNLNVA